VVERFSPLLLAQARYRMGPKLRALFDVDDLVNDVWAVALPRLAELGKHEGRSTPVLVKFLATTLLYRVNQLLKKHIAGKRHARAGDDGHDPEKSRPIESLAAETSGVVTRAVQHELEGAVASALNELEPKDREILLLLGIEQNSNGTVAMLLGLTKSAVSMRYRRALERLRARLPDSVFDGLPEP
jgi:RNA polymerase sigma factor (sigma-70 family)